MGGEDVVGEVKGEEEGGRERDGRRGRLCERETFITELGEGRKRQ